MFQKIRRKVSTWLSKKSDFAPGRFNQWKVVRCIGQGQFGTVHLLKFDDQMICLKAIDMEKHSQDKTCFQQEMAIHNQLKHPHIIEMFASQATDNFLYLFMEYAPRGNLLDRIESNDPAAGISWTDAHNFFKQLIVGVDYLHRRGIAHRDLKPENLLIGEGDLLKIADFGLATVFRYEQEERPMTNFCGSIPYMAPEVYRSEYRAEAADVWSCGIILVNMLTKLSPWDQSTMFCRRFAAWATNRDVNGFPWVVIDVVALDLLKLVLHPDPVKRATIKHIKQSYYYLNDPRLY